jgi:hypothetical protein
MKNEPGKNISDGQKCGIENMELEFEAINQCFSFNQNDVRNESRFLLEQLII